MPLRLAKSDVTRVDLDQEGSYIEVVQDISKRDFNNLVAAMPQDIDQEKGLTPVQGTAFQSALFETFVKAWSLDLDPTVENYLLLSRDSAELIDDALIAHFQTLTPDAPKGAKPSGSQSRPRKETT